MRPTTFSTSAQPFCTAALPRRARRSIIVPVRAQTIAAAPSTQELYAELDAICDDYTRVPVALKQEVSAEVLTTMKKLRGAGALRKFGTAAADLAPRRNVLLGELRLVGVKAPEAVGKPSVRNDAAFLVTTVGSSSLAAVLCGALLPGDWGFFSSYLVGGVSLVVLAIGSVNPGILQFSIDQFSQVFPDYKERVLCHEAAHFLAGYLMAVPVASYSLTMGKEHTDFAEAKLQSRLIERKLEAGEVDVLSIVALAGATAEALQYEDVIGQTADLDDLQRILLRSAAPMNAAAQQNQTRWACYQAASLLRTYAAEHAALREAMQRGARVAECIRAIEGAGAA